jgi:hypothetical protein
LEVIMADILPRPLGNPFGGIIGNELRYMANTLGQNRIPYFAPNSTLGARIGSIPVKDKTGESYRDAELRLSAAARAAAGPSAGGGLGGGNAASSLSTGFRPIGGTPEERAQAAETSRIAQLTAQNPELQRYEVARKAAAAQGATPEQVQSAEDLGMQIWAQKYGKTLAPKVKPGQAGYDVIQRTLYPGGAPLPALPAESVAMLDAIAPADATGIRPDITPMPGALPVFSDASDDMYQAVMGIGGVLPSPATQNLSPAAASSQQAGGVSFEDVSFQTPASQRRSDLFAQLLQGIRQYGRNP